jgi:D-alanine-D-alanine ligase
VGKLTVGVVFGGRSAEHEVSLVSATSILKALDPERYRVVPIGISKDGRWIVHEKALEWLKENTVPDRFRCAVFPEPEESRLLIVEENGGNVSFRYSPAIDLFFPVLHGTFGEDGTIQGLFELMDVPYVGAGVLGSAVGMDKVVQKTLLRFAGLPVVQFLSYTQEQNPLHVKGEIKEIETKLHYPIFVKPANLGSSVGITKAHNRGELRTGIELAFQYDRKIILEQGIEPVREIEISVLGNESPRASLPGEIIPSREFYDYEAKYVDDGSKLLIPAPLPEETVKRIQELAIRAYQVAGCEGMARVDFLMRGDELYVSEINTIPGFTMISMYPKLWEASGLPFSRLLDELIDLAMRRHQARKRLRTSYESESDWYRRTTT